MSEKLREFLLGGTEPTNWRRLPLRLWVFCILFVALGALAYYDATTYWPRIEPVMRVSYEVAAWVVVGSGGVLSSLARRKGRQTPRNGHETSSPCPYLPPDLENFATKADFNLLGAKISELSLHIDKLDPGLKDDVVQLRRDHDIEKLAVRELFRLTAIETGERIQKTIDKAVERLMDHTSQENARLTDSLEGRDMRIKDSAAVSAARAVTPMIKKTEERLDGIEKTLARIEAK